MWGRSGPQKLRPPTRPFFLPQQLRQLGDIRGDPPRLIAREQLGLNVSFAPKNGH